MQHQAFWHCQCCCSYYGRKDSNPQRHVLCNFSFEANQREEDSNLGTSRQVQFVLWLISSFVRVSSPQESLAKYPSSLWEGDDYVFGATKKEWFVFCHLSFGAGSLTCKEMIRYQCGPLAAMLGKAGYAAPMRKPERCSIHLPYPIVTS